MSTQELSPIGLFYERLRRVVVHGGDTHSIKSHNPRPNSATNPFVQTSLLLDPNYYEISNPELPRPPIAKLSREEAQTVAKNVRGARGPFDSKAFINFAKSFNGKTNRAPLQFMKHSDSEIFECLSNPGAQVSAPFIDAHTEMVYSIEEPPNVATMSASMWPDMMTPCPGNNVVNLSACAKHTAWYCNNDTATSRENHSLFQNTANDKKVDSALFPMRVTPTGNPDETGHWILVVCFLTRAKKSRSSLDSEAPPLHISAVIYNPLPYTDDPFISDEVCMTAAKNAVLWLSRLNAHTYKDETFVGSDYDVVNGLQDNDLSCGLWVMQAISTCIKLFNDNTYKSFPLMDRILIVKEALSRGCVTQHWKNSYFINACDYINRIHGDCFFADYVRNPFRFLDDTIAPGMPVIRLPSPQQNHGPSDMDIV